METKKNNIEFIPEFEKSFRHPRNWGAWLGVYAFAGIAMLPASVRDPGIALFREAVVEIDLRATAGTFAHSSCKTANFPQNGIAHRGR